MIRIRRSNRKDIDAIMECYETARQYMRANGNASQWVNGYPSRELVESDIASGAGYVGEDEEGRPVMAFAFIIGDDPTYADIRDGEWLDRRPYGTIHRLGSNGRQRGVLRACVSFCLGIIDNIRLDTHADNLTMQRGVEALGFAKCGIIFCQDGTPRIAYQLSNRKS